MITDDPIQDARRLYIDLMRKCVIGLIYGDPALEWDGTGTRPLDPVARDMGRDWPAHGHSMIGHRRMLQLQHAVESVLARGIPGDFIETGVWRGGACIFMRAILKAYAEPRRKVWVADSFAGVPPPDPDRYPADADDRHHEFSTLVVPLEDVQRNFARYGLLDQQVVFLKGRFRDTLPDAPIERLAILRLDGDMYESTIDALDALYGKLSRGGIVIVDDYGYADPCRKAVEDFRAAHAVTEVLQDIDGMGYFWEKAIY